MCVCVCVYACVHKSVCACVHAFGITCVCVCARAHVSEQYAQYEHLCNVSV